MGCDGGTENYAEDQSELLQDIISRWTRAYPREAYPYIRDIIAAMKDLKTVFEIYYYTAKKAKDEDATEANQMTIKIIEKWMTRQGQADEDEAQKWRRWCKEMKRCLRNSSLTTGMLA